jgi:NAD-dependent deacetylase
MTHAATHLVERAAELLGAARQVVVFSGAGLSTASGIPDYRSPNSGLWEKADPYEVASLTAFRHHPERFFNWIKPLAHTIANAQPNAAHFALARLEKAQRLNAIITQNIDGLHQRAGSTNVLEIHGGLGTASCGACHRTVEAAPHWEAFNRNGFFPACPHCGGLLKPNVILMEEQLPVLVFHKARRAAQTCDLMLVLGSSLEVLPAARLPIEALNVGAKLIMINLSQTYLDERADVLIHADITTVLPEIVAAAGVPLDE